MTSVLDQASTQFASIGIDIGKDERENAGGSIWENGCRSGKSGSSTRCKV